MKRFFGILILVSLIFAGGLAAGVFSAMRFSSLFSRLGGQAPRLDHFFELARFAVYHRSDSFIEEGAQLFQNGCAQCHAPDGSGGRGPALDGSKFSGVRGTFALFEIIQNGIPGTEMPPSPQITPREKLRILAFVKNLQSAPPVAAGNVQAGRELYDKSGCAGCHRIGNEGRATGIDLARIGIRRVPQYLRDSLVKPSADVPDRYLLVRAVTRDGKTYSGARQYEDTFSIQFYDDQDQLHAFWKDELEKLETLPGESPMPSYEAVLSAAQLDDLVAYLSSLR